MKLHYLIICLTGLLLSCSGRSEDTINDTENLKKTLDKQLSEFQTEKIRTKQEEAKIEKKIQEEEEEQEKLREQEKKIKNALQGTWEWNNSKLVINGGMIYNYVSGTLHSQGDISLFDSTRISYYDLYSNHGWLGFDIDLDNNGRVTLYHDRKNEIRYTKTSSSAKTMSRQEAPYGYNQWGEPYASLDEKKLDKALDEFDEARLNYIKALDVRDPMAIMYYHQRMKLIIGDCLLYAKGLGDRKIINKLEEYEKWVDNLKY